MYMDGFIIKFPFPIIMISSIAFGADFEKSSQLIELQSTFGVIHNKDCTYSIYLNPNDPIRFFLWLDFPL